MALGVASSTNVLCLTWDASGLYACADEFLQGFTAGKSTDEGKTFTPIMHLADLCGPLDCPAASSVGEQCPTLWPTVQATIAAECPTGGSGGASSTSSSGAAMGSGGGSHGSGGSGGGSVIKSGCSCTVPGPLGDDPALALGGLVAAAFVARRRRAPRI
jgi:MYXO-CTERM domain-containing protein